MIYINSCIKSFDTDDIFVVLDFDRTMTSSDSETSWGILERNDILDKNYKHDSHKLYDYYRHKEIDSSISDTEKEKLMEMWMDEQVKLLMKYQVDENIFNNLLTLTDKMQIRNGLDTFLKSLNVLHVPVIIISAGLGNAIIKFLKENHLFLDNIMIISNILEFDNHNIYIKDDKINSISKGHILIPDLFTEQIKHKKAYLLFGDQISDLIIMKSFHTPFKITTCFLSPDTKQDIEEYKNHYDIVATDNESFENISKILIKK